MNINQLTTEQSIQAKTRAYNVEKRQGFHKQAKASFSLPAGFVGSVFVSNDTLNGLNQAKQEGF